MFKSLKMHIPKIKKYELHLINIKMYFSLVIKQKIKIFEYIKLLKKHVINFPMYYIYKYQIDTSLLSFNYLYLNFD